MIVENIIFAGLFIGNILIYLLISILFVYPSNLIIKYLKSKWQRRGLLMTANVVATTVLLLMFFIVCELAITSRFEEAFQKGTMRLAYPVWWLIVFIFMVITNARTINSKTPTKLDSP